MKYFGSSFKLAEEYFFEMDPNAVRQESPTQTLARVRRRFTDAKPVRDTDSPHNNESNLASVMRFDKGVRSFVGDSLIDGLEELISPSCIIESEQESSEVIFSSDNRADVPCARNAAQDPRRVSSPLAVISTDIRQNSQSPTPLNGCQRLGASSRSGDALNEHVSKQSAVIRLIDTHISYILSTNLVTYFSTFLVK